VEQKAIKPIDKNINKMNRTKFTIMVAAFLALLFTFFNASAQVRGCYVDNNNQLTISFLTETDPTHYRLDNVSVTYPSAVKEHINAVMHYPVTGMVDITKEGKYYRVTVYQIRFNTGRIYLPAEMFSVRGHKLTKNKSGVISTRELRNFIIRYFAK